MPAIPAFLPAMPAFSILQWNVRCRHLWPGYKFLITADSFCGSGGEPLSWTANGEVLGVILQHPGYFLLISCCTHGLMIIQHSIPRYCSTGIMMGSATVDIAFTQTYKIYLFKLAADVGKIGEFFHNCGCSILVIIWGFSEDLITLN